MSGCRHLRRKNDEEMRETEEGFVRGDFTRLVTKSDGRAFFRRRSRGYRAPRVDRLILLNARIRSALVRCESCRSARHLSADSSGILLGIRIRARSYDLPPKIVPDTRESLRSRGEKGSGNRRRERFKIDCPVFIIFRDFREGRVVLSIPESNLEIYLKKWRTPGKSCSPPSRVRI